MAHYLCKNVVDLPEYMFADVLVGATTLNAGQVVVADDLDATLYGNLKNYTPAQATDVTTQSLAILLNGSFETMPGGRRPDGNPDYTTYTFAQGEVVTAVRLMPNQRFEISVEACATDVATAVSNGTLVVGDNLIPVNGKYTLKLSPRATAVTTKNYLTIEKIKQFRVGTDFITTLVVRAK